MICSVCSRETGILESGGEGLPKRACPACTNAARARRDVEWEPLRRALMTAVMKWGMECEFLRGLPPIDYLLFPRCRATAQYLAGGGAGPAWVSCGAFPRVAEGEAALRSAVSVELNGMGLDMASFQNAIEWSPGQGGRIEGKPFGMGSNPHGRPYGHFFRIA